MHKIYTMSAFLKKVAGYERGGLFEKYIINLLNKEKYY